VENIENFSNKAHFGLKLKLFPSPEVLKKLWHTSYNEYPLTIHKLSVYTHSHIIYILFAFIRIFT